MGGVKRWIKCLCLAAFVVLLGAMGTVQAFPGATRHSGNYGPSLDGGGAR